MTISPVQNSLPMQGVLQAKILGINSLYHQPLKLTIPAEKLIVGEDGTPGLPYGLLNAIDRVLRTVRMNVPESAYEALARDMQLEEGNGPHDFWHYRHWDDGDDLATFNVQFPDAHPSAFVAGRHLLATTQYRLMASPCLAPQIEHERKLMMLVGEDGNMVLPFDKPLDENGNAVNLGTILLHKEQFPKYQQAELAADLLREYGYIVDIV